MAFFLQLHHEVDVYFFSANVLATPGWIVMEFSEDIHCCKRMYPNNFGDSPTDLWF